MLKRLIKNAFFNVLRGGAAAMVAIVLLPVLTRVLPSQVYGTWALVLQLSAYVGYLDFGIQTAVGRYVAHTTELAEHEKRNQIISTALALLIGAGLLGMGLTFILAWQLPNIFREMPESLHAETRLALLLVGGSLSLGLPFSIFNGIFIGLQRNEIPALTVGGGKLLGAVLTMVIALSGLGLVEMGIGMAVANIIAAFAQYLFYKRLIPDISISFNLVGKRHMRELLSYCFSLMIWSFAMLLVTGLDTTIVGLFDYSAVAYYSVAATLVTFLVGLQSAVFNVLMPHAATLGARNDSEGLGKLLISSTRYGVFILWLAGLPFLLFANPILSLWVGPEYATKTAPLLQILIVANIIRWSAAPYTTMLVGTGQQRLVIISPIIEGAVNLIVSLAAGSVWGVTGVALGTLAGGIVGVMSNLLFNMLRTKGIAMQRKKYILDGLVRPTFCLVPLTLGLIILQIWPISQMLITIPLVMAATALCAILVWRFGMFGNERDFVLERLKLMPR